MRRGKKQKMKTSQNLSYMSNDKELKEDGIETEMVGGFKGRKETRVVRKAGRYRKGVQEDRPQFIYKMHF